jgi:hypothetical protein
LTRAKPSFWEEVNRRDLGVSARMVPDVGGTFVLLYEVTERRTVRGKAVEWRERVVPGVTLYQASTGFIGTSALLEVVAKGVAALSSIARVEDETAQKQKRATSRRKGR